MLVQDVMDRSYPSVYSDELATKARAILRDLGLRVLPTVDEHKQLLGVISRRDVMTISSSVSPLRVKGIMSAARFVATSDMDAFDVAREMMRLDEWYVPVVKSRQDNFYRGMVGFEHMIKALCDRKAARLSTPLSEVMSSAPFVCSPNDEADNVWRMMTERSFAACPVVVNGKPTGMISQQDLLESGAIFPTFEAKKGRFKTSATISTVMKTPAVTLREKDTVKDAAKLMLEKNIGRVPIVDAKGRLIGIVDREDVLRTLMA